MLSEQPILAIGITARIETGIDHAANHGVRQKLRQTVANGRGFGRPAKLSHWVSFPLVGLLANTCRRA
jgi:hypothetical protein